METIIGKQQTTSYFGWLQAFSLFLYPFMPKLGKALWHTLGYQHLPTMDGLYYFPLHQTSNAKLHCSKSKPIQDGVEVHPVQFALG
ncbi:hypothetical protein [Legionella bononiensis]|uniref:Uncharacterized protein n=1 Tax=Legionella bononiensis TaxID=2793102 RepID=A0ABS1WAN2_9GAMM|nr:hypothetical protein [Legionella bononiensis]MBL7480347.1 hypothetical protein [Legionella bononiensis]MBL7526421.1 hypothetical protein [Legionella bononiensis]MBL7563085.1 hypothetical protein [Legionella bononiensis]